MHPEQANIFRKKSFLWRMKYAVLLWVMAVISSIPLLGKVGKNNANKMLFRKEQVKLHHIPSELAGVSFLFLTDPHIGGNIDAIASEVSAGIHTLLQSHDPRKTFILHGGDFICGDGGIGSKSVDDITSVASSLFAGLENYRHFGVIGNHDDDDLDFPRMRQHLEDTLKMHFMVDPRDTRRIVIEDREICIHGIHTLLDHLETMKIQERNMLLDTYIHLLTTSQADFHVVLLHNPDGLEYLLRRLVETKKIFTTPILFLAGHTHGATMDFPFLRHSALRVSKTRFGRYKGWYHPSGKYAQTGNWTLYVSTGMGNGPGFDFRLNAQPEVVLFTL